MCCVKEKPACTHYRNHNISLNPKAKIICNTFIINLNVLLNIKKKSMQILNDLLQSCAGATEKNQVFNSDNEDTMSRCVWRVGFNYLRLKN